MEAIDVHAHAFPDPVAAKAIPKLEAHGNCKAVGDGTLSGLIRAMDANGVQAAFLCAIATNPAQTPSILQWCRDIAGERVVPFPSVHPDDPHGARWITDFARAGFHGVKLHPQYQAFAADEERLSPLYTALSETGLLLVSHCGLDFAFPDDDDRASPARFARVLDRFPDLRLLATHMGGYRSWDDVERLLLGRDIYLETSFSLDRLGAERAADLIRRHGVGRVMFGTDWPWRDHATELAAIDALPLTPEEKRAILYGNAARLLAS